MLWKYLGRVFGNWWSLIAIISTIITFVTLFVDIQVDVVNLTPTWRLAFTVIGILSIFTAGFLVWRNDFQEYHRTDPEIRCDKKSSITLKQWLDIEPKTGFYVTEIVITSFSASLTVYNPGPRLMQLKVKVADIDSNWTAREKPEEPKVTHPHRAGQYPGGVIDVGAANTVPISVSFDIRFTPSIDKDGKRYLECLRELVIVLDFEAPGRKPVTVPIELDCISVHDQVKKRISGLMDHDLVKQNHWQEQGLELFAKYQNGC